MSIEIRIVCDLCMTCQPQFGWGWQKDGAKPAEMRRVLKERMKWKVGLKGGVDLCPHCAEIVEIEKRAGYNNDA
jgi:hypothetical protein